MPAGVVAAAAAAAGAYLRIAEAPDAVLTQGAGTALALAEAFCGQRLIGRACEDVIGVGRDWQRLAQRPVSAIRGLTGLQAPGAPFVLPVDAYAVDIDADGNGWVRVTTPGAAMRVAVSYTAGLAAAWDALPEPVAQGVTLLAAHLFEHREGSAAPPAAVAALWRPFRRMRL
ncbi:head-tail connector protein [Sphingomonas insulae]|nr:hypothetical protein [Sphingomonas insulae]